MNTGRLGVVVSAAAFIALASTDPARAALCSDGMNRPVCVWLGSPGIPGHPSFPSFFPPQGSGLRSIDFQSLPDGTPTFPGMELGPAVNYTAWGVTFSTLRFPPYPLYPLFISGPVGDLDLSVSHPNALIHVGIYADFVAPAHGVGTFFPGETTLYIYDPQGALIASATDDAVLGVGFIGITSDAPIARAVISEGSASEDIRDFYFFPAVPEAPTVFLLVFAGVCAMHRRGRSGVLSMH